MRPGRSLVLAAIGALVLACGTSAPTPTSTPSRSPTAPPSPPSPPATVDASGTVPIDPALLDHLPAEVDGLPVARRPETDALAAADPVVVEFGEAVVTGLVVDPASGEFAYASVVRLRAGAFSEDLYRSWRDTFDEGACSQAGGVTRTAVTTIGGREVHVDSCAGGLRVYHAWLGNSRVLVSVSAVGERRLGERLVEALED